jgi:hypothetical protein
LADFDKIYKKKFIAGDLGANVKDSMNLGGGYGAIKTDDGETIGFVPLDKGSEKELKERFKKGQWRGY